MTFKFSKEHWLTKPRLLGLAPEKEEEIKLKPIQVAARIAVAIITAAWVGFLPFYLFLIYMHEARFFSYDFFVDGVFGLNTFVAASAILLTFISLYFYGFLLFLKLGLKQEKHEGKNEFRFLAWTAVVVSWVVHYLLLEITLSAGKPQLFFWLIGISLVFCMFFYSLVGHSLKHSLQNWISPILFVAATIFLPFLFRDATAEAVAMGLRSFNMGGGQIVQVYDQSKDSESAISGRLILLTPKNIYLTFPGKDIVIIPINNHTHVVVKN